MLKFFDAIRDGENSDPGWKKVGSRIGKNTPDPKHCILERLLVRLENVTN
jgi:hypothetical protein